MKIYLTQVERILNTLPIGTYLGRRIPVTLSEESETSFIDLIDQQIVVAFSNIVDCCEKINDEKYVETAIRTCLYHEVSHAILTSKELAEYSARRGDTTKKVMNIFEDERIETALRYYYKNVDFEKNVRLLNDWESIKHNKPRNELDAFYRVVRFHNGKREWVEEAERLIEHYSYLSVGDFYIWPYVNDVMALFYKIEEEFPYTNEEDWADGDSTEGVGDFGDMRGTCAPSDKCESSEGQEDKSKVESEDGDTPDEDMLKKIKSILNKEFSTIEWDNCMYGEIFPIISQFNKKTSGGSAIAAHSGVFNPRLASRNDYRFFERKSVERGSNQFTSIHINLFLDESGSYCGNVPKTNQLISALAQIEKFDKNFTFDIVYCGEGERIVTDKTKRTMKAKGGNDLDNKVFDIYRRLQKPNTYNYNIVLFDGDAFTDSYDRLGSFKNFGAFNHSNCTVISDPTNSHAIDKYAPSARRIYTWNYVEELQKNVIAALRFAFR